MKILIIGQAPPAVEQSVPYDTTMLYQIFQDANIDITKENALERCTFAAVYDKFPGRDENGGHKAPTKKQMQDAWFRYLKAEVESHDKVLVFGKVAEDFIKSILWRLNKFHFFPHPSYRNHSLWKKDYPKLLEKMYLALSEQDI